MSAFDEIVKQGVARLSPATMIAIRQHVARIEEQRVALATASAPLFGIRLVVDRDIDRTWALRRRVRAMRLHGLPRHGRTEPRGRRRSLHPLPSMSDEPRRDR